MQAGVQKNSKQKNRMSNRQRRPEPGVGRYRYRKGSDELATITETLGFK